MYVEKIMNVYISLYSSVWNKRLDDNIYSMLTWDPGAVFTKGLKSRVLSLDLSHDLGQDSRRIH